MKGQGAVVAATIVVILGVLIIPSLLAEANPAFSNYRTLLIGMLGIEQNPELLTFPLVLGALAVPFAGIVVIATLIIRSALSFVNMPVQTSNTLVGLIAVVIATEMLVGPALGFPGLNVLAYMYLAIGWTVIPLFTAIFFLGIYFWGFWKRGGRAEKNLVQKELKMEEKTVKEMEQNYKNLQAMIYKLDVDIKNMEKELVTLDPRLPGQSQRANVLQSEITRMKSEKAFLESKIEHG